MTCRGPVLESCSGVCYCPVTLKDDYDCDECDPWTEADYEYDRGADT